MRRLLVAAVRPACLEQAGLLLSGGRDSLSILFAMLELGYKPPCYIGVLDGYRSSDIQTAETVCRLFDVPLQVVVYPRLDNAQFKQALLDAMAVVKSCNGYDVLGGYMYGYLADHIQQPAVAGGHGGDLVYGGETHPQRSWGGTNKLPELAFYKAWYVPSNLLYEDSEVLLALRAKGKQLLVPYHDPDLVNWFIARHDSELNQPYIKAATVAAFSDYFHQFKFYPSLGASRGAGLYTALQELLEDPEYNPQNYKTVNALVYSWGQTVFGDERSRYKDHNPDDTFPH